MLSRMSLWPFRLENFKLKSLKWVPSLPVGVGKQKVVCCTPCKTITGLSGQVVIITRQNRAPRLRHTSAANGYACTTKHLSIRCPSPRLKPVKTRMQFGCNQYSDEHPSGHTDKQHASFSNWFYICSIRGLTNCNGKRNSTELHKVELGIPPESLVALN